MLDTTILQALDAVETTSLGASLAGLSISASSFLANLVKTTSDKVKPLEAKWKEAVQEENSSPLHTKEARKQITAEALGKYTAEKQVADDAVGAMKALLWAFAFFAANLIWSLTGDPVVEKSVSDAKEAGGTALEIATLGYKELLPIDVGISSVTLVLGLAALGYGARSMYKVIPKLKA
ncbi:MAG: hypothetical protein WDO56_00115 [Gammaproteobacteria bacterium]